MDKHNLDISAIEKYVADYIKSSTTYKNVFSGSLPTTIGSTWTEFFMVKVSAQTTDMNAYGKAVVAIHMYPKSNLKSNGAKDTATCIKLGKAIREAIDAHTSDTYMIKYIAQIPEYNETLKIHYNVALVSVLIV